MLSFLMKYKTYAILTVEYTNYAFVRKYLNSNGFVYVQEAQSGSVYKVFFSKFYSVFQ